MRKVLVTGASGFIGQHCLSLLAERGFEVHAVRQKRPECSLPEVSWHQADLLSPRQTGRLMRKVAPSHLLHLAWYAEPESYWYSPNNLDWVRSSLTLIQQFVRRGGRRAVIAGTCAEYDWSQGQCNEEDTRLRPQGLYGACKHALQVIASAYADTTDLSLGWGRVFFLYGPGEPSQRLVPSVIRSLLRGEIATCRHGQLARDYIHVEDAARALAALVDCDARGPVNVASGREVHLRDLVSMIGRLLECEELLNIIEEPIKPVRIVADVTRLNEAIGFSSALDLHTGLDRTITWWKQQSRMAP